MPENAKLSVALIGLGHIAQKAYLPILANHARVNPILCTRNTETLSRLSHEYRINTTYKNLEDLINSKPDAAMVHSSTESHPFILSKLLMAKIPVFVDKPIGYSIDDSEKLLNLALKNRLPLYVGFNRRFAPLVKSLSKQPDPTQITWQKNRVDLPGDPRVFIFDDFIHVVDGLRFLGKGELKSLSVASRIKNKKLENIQIQWQEGDTFLIGGMNRISGVTEENIEYYTEGNKWIINNLHSGMHFSEREEKTLGFSNWDSTLYKRGFVDMIEDWINVLEERRSNSESIEDIWKTHQACEEILRAVLKNDADNRVG